MRSALLISKSNVNAKSVTFFLGSSFAKLLVSYFFEKLTLLNCKGNKTPKNFNTPKP